MQQICVNACIMYMYIMFANHGGLCGVLSLLFEKTDYAKQLSASEMIMVISRVKLYTNRKFMEICLSIFQQYNKKNATASYLFILMRWVW